MPFVRSPLVDRQHRLVPGDEPAEEVVLGAVGLERLDGADARRGDAGGRGLGFDHLAVQRTQALGRPPDGDDAGDRQRQRHCGEQDVVPQEERAVDDGDDAAHRGVRELPAELPGDAVVQRDGVGGVACGPRHEVADGQPHRVPHRLRHHVDRHLAGQAVEGQVLHATQHHLDDERSREPDEHHREPVVARADEVAVDEGARQACDDEPGDGERGAGEDRQHVARAHDTQPTAERAAGPELLLVGQERGARREEQVEPVDVDGGAAVGRLAAVCHDEAEPRRHRPDPIDGRVAVVGGERAPHLVSRDRAVESGEGVDQRVGEVVITAAARVAPRCRRELVGRHGAGVNRRSATPGFLRRSRSSRSRGWRSRS